MNRQDKKLPMDHFPNKKMKQSQTYNYTYNGSKKKLKVSPLEEQLKSKDERIKHLKRLNQDKSKCNREKNPNEPSISDSMFLDLFSILKFG
jgi:hypothetical protein